MVRKTAGWEYDPEKDKMVQKYLIVGYAATRAEGLQMLAEYNQNPFDVKGLQGHLPGGIRPVVKGEVPHHLKIQRPRLRSLL